MAGTKSSGVVSEDCTTLVEEEDGVDGHDCDGLTDTGSDGCDDTVSEQLFESLCHGTECHTIIRVANR